MGVGPWYYIDRVQTDWFRYRGEDSGMGQQILGDEVGQRPVDLRRRERTALLGHQRDGHGERAGKGDLGRAIGVLAQEFHIVPFDRATALHPAYHARHRRLVAAARGDHRRIFVVDAFKCGREAIGIALAADFAVGHDVDAGALHENVKF